MPRLFTLLSSLVLIAAFTVPASAQQHSASATTPNASAASATSASAHASAPPSSSSNSRTAYYDARTLRIKGEQAFRTNCGRCHQPPHKFPPRVMAAAIRHMRVRAMLTDEDMRLILLYMTQ